MNHIINNKILVVHEGLKNTPSAKEELRQHIDKLNFIMNNEHSHLCDVACHLSFVIKDLQKLKERLFKLHKEESNAPLNSSLTNP